MAKRYGRGQLGHGKPYWINRYGRIRFDKEHSWNVYGWHLWNDWSREDMRLRFYGPRKCLNTCSKDPGERFRVWPVRRFRNYFVYTNRNGKKQYR